MNYDELRDLYRKGNDVGSHTHTHPHLTKLSENELEFELSKSQALLGRFGSGLLSYPYGEFDRRVIDHAKKYYVAARGYYDTTTLGRSCGYNFGLSKERYRLKVFPTEHPFPPHNCSLLGLPFPKFKEIMKRITENQGEERKYAIFVFHGRETSIRNIAWTLCKRKRAVAEYAEQALHLCSLTDLIKNTILDTNELLKFEWMCEYLASSDLTEILTVSEAVDRLYRI